LGKREAGPGPRRSSPASNRYIGGSDVSAAVMGVDRSDMDADVNEVDAATSTQTGLERGEHPGEGPRWGVKAGAVSVLPGPLFPLTRTPLRALMASASCPDHT
jgi:hypothetical protein